MARSSGRGTLASRDYHMAAVTHGHIAVEKKNEAAFRKKQEYARQGEERTNLTKAYKIEKGRFEDEWAERIATVEAECAEKERVLKEVHEIARMDVEKLIEKKVAATRYKATSTLLQLEDTERKLARLNEFKEAAEVAARAHRQRLLDRAAFERDRSKLGTRPRCAPLLPWVAWPWAASRRAARPARAHGLVCWRADARRSRVRFLTR